ILKAELVQLEQTKDYPAYTESLLQLVYQYELAQLPDRALFYVEKGQAFLPKENEASHHKLNYKWHVLTFEKGAMDAGRVFHLDSAYASLQRFADEATIISFLKYYAYRQQSCLLYQEGHQTLQLLQEKCESQDSLSHHLVEIYNQLQRSAKDLGEFEAALDYIRKGIEASQASEDYAYIVNLYIDNGVLLGMLGMDGVYESYQKALEVARSKGTEREVASVQISLASHYNAQEEPVKALEALKESKTIFSKLGEKTALISINTEMANAYFELGNIEKGMQLFEENIQLCDADYQSSCSTIYYRYAYRLDSIAPIDTLITLLEKQIALSKQLQDRPILASSYEFLYGLYKDKADFSNALYYLEEAKQLQDSLNTAQLDAKLAEEGTRQKVETFQTQKEAAEQESRVLSYRNRLFVGFSLVLLGLLVLTLFLITQLRKTRKRLATQNERLAQLNTTKDRFFGIIAHDIRSPITALSNVGEQMDYYLVKNNLLKLKRLSGRIDKTAQKLTRLLDNLLNWALLQNGMIPYHPQSIDVHGIVAENLLLYQEIAETKGIQLHNEVEPGTMVFVDESATSTIVRNLINNAVKFTASGGTVEVSTEDKGDQVFIRINDTGTGISAEKLPTIFSLKGSRSRGTNQESGTGLGLMLCKDLVELNKGTIRVDSELGKGSSFIVSLPRKKVG
ncbi:MAG: HAMP domain-containing sensor histidine kinase, partial [Bacteroidota bacterium]